MVSNIIRSFEAQASQLLGLKGDGVVVQSPLWAPDLHLPQLEAFLREASNETRQDGVLTAYLGSAPQSPQKLILQEGLPPPGAPFVYLVRPGGAAHEEEGFCSDSCLDPHDILGAVFHLLKCFADCNEQHTPNVLQLTLDELAGHLQQFRTAVDEAMSSIKGQTLLYVPGDDINDSSSALKDKALLRRLEATLLHWTGQVKSVLHQYPPDVNTALEGPLAEYQFWKQRTENLHGIVLQVNSEGIKRITALLERADSCYLHEFLGLSRSLTSAADVAAKKMRALSILVEPCAALSVSSVQDIHKELPAIVAKLRVIWNLCPSYGTIEPFTTLLRRISNEIIKTCTQSPLLFNAVLDSPRSCANHIQASILVVNGWQVWYDRAALSASTTYSGKPWQANKAAIFSQMDTFLQRCRELLYLCAATKQFANPDTIRCVTNKGYAMDGVGLMWTTVARSLNDLQSSSSLVNASLEAWKPVYTTINTMIQEIEKLFSSLVHSAIHCSGSLYLKAYNIQVASEIAQTRASILCLAQCVAEVQKDDDEHVLDSRYISKVDSIQRVARQAPYGHLSLAKHAGTGLMAFHSRHRLSAALSMVLGVHGDGLADNKIAKHAHMQSASEQALSASYMTSLHAQWYNGVTRDFTTLISRPLIWQDKRKSGCLATNISPHIHNALGESFLWEQMKQSLPDGISDLNTQRSRLSRADSKALAVVQQYNKIVNSISKGERKLFQGRLRQLDRKTLAATTKLTLISTKSAIDAYCLEALKQCRETKLLKFSWSNGQKVIDESHQAIKSTELSYIVSQHHALDLASCSSLQATHCSKVTGDLGALYNSIVKVIDKMHDLAAVEGNNLQKEWSHFLGKVKETTENALSQAMHKTLSTMNKLLFRSDIGPTTSLFRASLTLASTARVEVQPGVQEIFNTLHEAAEDCFNVARYFQTTRDADVMGEGNATSASHLIFSRGIDNKKNGEGKYDEGFLDSAKTAMVEKMEAYLLTWERKYHMLWDQDKNIFIRRYEKAKKSAQDFQADVVGYKKMKEQVLAEPSVEYIRFLQVESHQFKQLLVEHCNQWIMKLLALMVRIVERTLHEIVSFLATTTLQSPMMYSHKVAIIDNSNIQEVQDTGSDKMKGSGKYVMGLYETLIRLGGVPLEDASHQEFDMVKKWMTGDPGQDPEPT